jgi:tetratricopeptide (TPR) repeat protein
MKRLSSSSRLAVALAICLAGCQASDRDAKQRPAPGLWWDGSFPEGCAETAGDDAALCGERLFWQTFQYDRGRGRRTHENLGELGARTDLTRAQRARLYWRRAQLATALGAEQADFVPYATAIQDLDKAAELAPEAIEIAFWASFTRLFVGYISGDAAMYQAGDQEFWKLMRRDPSYGVFFAMTLAGLPLDSGQPQRVPGEILAFDCNGRNWCERESDWVPFQQAGAALAFAEVFIRMGDKPHAADYLQRALTAPRADRWPFRALARELEENLDHEIAKYAARGTSQAVLDLMKTGGEAACASCHGPAR